MNGISMTKGQQTKTKERRHHAQKQSHTHHLWMIMSMAVENSIIHPNSNDQEGTHNAELINLDTQPCLNRKRGH